MQNSKTKIGIIGSGWVGSSYMKDFMKRGFRPICYSLEPEYRNNKDKVKTCDIVFIAVPTLTTSRGFDDSILRKIIKLVGKSKIAVIKSTVLPGITNLIQKENPEIYVIHAPEFLLERSARHDASHPLRNIVGIPKDTAMFHKKAKQVLSILPVAPVNIICSATEAELIKYARNCVGYLRVVFYNLLYDVARKNNADWAIIRKAIAADPDNGPTYTNPVHKGGRGAGGNRFIKDFVAFRRYYEKNVSDPLGLKILKDLEKKNINLLKQSRKDLRILKEVYGKI